MLTFILPFYKKLALFSLALPHNAAVFGADAEVILCLDEPSEEKAIVDLISRWKPIRFVVIVNDQEHEWRPPCKAINAGLRHARGEQVGILSPETIIKLPCADYLARCEPCRERWEFRSGRLWHNDHNPFGNAALARTVATFDRTKIGDAIGFGFMLAPLWALEAVRGYDELRLHYGFDDDCIRQRLMNLGLWCAVDPHIKLLHLDHAGPIRGAPRDARALGPVLHHQPDWGRDFSRIAYHWRTA